MSEQSRFPQESPAMVVSSPETPRSSAYLVGEVVERFRAVIGQVCRREVGPEVLDRVEFGRVGRKKFGTEPAQLRSNELLRELAAMRGQAVPQQDDLAANVTAQIPEKVNHRVAVDVSMLKRKKPSRFSPRWRGGQGANRRQPLPIEWKPENGRLGARRPRPADTGTFGETAFVEEN